MQFEVVKFPRDVSGCSVEGALCGRIVKVLPGKNESTLMYIRGRNADDMVVECSSGTTFTAELKRGMYVLLDRPTVQRVDRKWHYTNSNYMAKPRPGEPVHVLMKSALTAMTGLGSELNIADVSLPCLQLEDVRPNRAVNVLAVMRSSSIDSTSKRSSVKVVLVGNTCSMELLMGLQEPGEFELQLKPGELLFISNALVCPSFYNDKFKLYLRSTRNSIITTDNESIKDLVLESVINAAKLWNHAEAVSKVQRELTAPDCDTLDSLDMLLDPTVPGGTYVVKGRTKKLVFFNKNTVALAEQRCPRWNLGDKPHLCQMSAGGIWCTECNAYLTDYNVGYCGLLVVHGRDGTELSCRLMDGAGNYITGFSNPREYLASVESLAGAEKARHQLSLSSRILHRDYALAIWKITTDGDLTFRLKGMMPYDAEPNITLPPTLNTPIKPAMTRKRNYSVIDDD